MLRPTRKHNHSRHAGVIKTHAVDRSPALPAPPPSTARDPAAQLLREKSTDAGLRQLCSPPRAPGFLARAAGKRQPARLHLGETGRVGAEIVVMAVHGVVPAEQLVFLVADQLAESRVAIDRSTSRFDRTMPTPAAGLARSPTAPARYAPLQARPSARSSAAARALSRTISSLVASVWFRIRSPSRPMRARFPSATPPPQS